MPLTHPERLPLPLAAWGVLGTFAPIARQRDIAGRLARRLLEPGHAYRAVGGYAMEIDREDPFQAAMIVGLFDRHSLAVVRRYARPGSTVFDVGAHLGYFTMRFARWVGPRGAVHAFEPDPRLAPRVRRHVEINGLTWVSVNECGILDTVSSAHQLALPDQLGWSSTVPGVWDATRAVPVPVTTLDAYVAEREIDPRAIGVIKLDVEGAEPEALRGAARTLRQKEAALLVEHIPGRVRALGRDPGAVPALLRGHGYTAHVPVRRRWGFGLDPGSDPVIGEDVLFVKRF
jgi:FkbM family methyltransferase